MVSSRKKKKGQKKFLWVAYKLRGEQRQGIFCSYRYYRSYVKSTPVGASATHPRITSCTKSFVVLQYPVPDVGWMCDLDILENRWCCRRTKPPTDQEPTRERLTPVGVSTSWSPPISPDLTNPEPEPGRSILHTLSPVINIGKRDTRPATEIGPPEQVSIPIFAVRKMRSSSASDGRRRREERRVLTQNHLILIMYCESSSGSGIRSNHTEQNLVLRSANGVLDTIGIQT